MSRSEDLATKKIRLGLWLQAEQTILQGGQSYTIGNRTLTRGDLKTIADYILQLEKDIKKLERPNYIRTQRPVPRDI